ncbi:DUF6466 family protein [Alloscardovia venturai]|uniref:DUF6466 family protein n=1 Tax=Alloscardovia venturai TaxID=1769421 RepID=A0ABW2Y6B0_9BIFI
MDSYFTKVALIMNHDMNDMNQASNLTRHLATADLAGKAHNLAEPASQSQSKSQTRGSLALRITTVICTVLAIIATVLCGVNLLLSGLYNQATEDLNTSLAQYAQDNPDLTMIAAHQVVTDEQFMTASAIAQVAFPQLRSSVLHNQLVSRALTKQVNDDLKKSSTDDASQSSDAQDTSSTYQQDSSSAQSSKTDKTDTKQDSDTAERMKTVTDNNTRNQRAYTPQAPQTTTKKPW